MVLINGWRFFETCCLFEEIQYSFVITTSGMLLKFTIYVEKENIIVYDNIIAGKIRIGFADPLNFNKSKKVEFWYYFNNFL